MCSERNRRSSREGKDRLLSLGDSEGDKDMGQWIRQSRKKSKSASSVDWKEDRFEMPEGHRREPTHSCRNEFLAWACFEGVDRERFGECNQPTNHGQNNCPLSMVELTTKGMSKSVSNAERYELDAGTTNEMNFIQEKGHYDGLLVDHRKGHYDGLLVDHRKGRYDGQLADHRKIFMQVYARNGPLQ